jgi:hypothetical protein
MLHCYVAIRVVNRKGDMTISQWLKFQGFTPKLALYIYFSPKGIIRGITVASTDRRMVADLFREVPI